MIAHPDYLDPVGYHSVRQLHLTTILLIGFCYLLSTTMATAFATVMGRTRDLYFIYHHFLTPFQR